MSEAPLSAKKVNKNIQKSDRLQRLSKALRENLLKRKQQSRDRKESKAPSEGKDLFV